MELPIIQYNLADVFGGWTPAICPKCLWRGLIQTPAEFLIEDFFCPECIKNKEEINLVQDIHWEAKTVISAIRGNGKPIKAIGDACCKDFIPGLEVIHKSCEHAALNGVGIKLPPIKYCPWCGDGPKEKNEIKT